MSVELLTEHHLEFLSLKGGCRGSSESTFDKMSNRWKSHAAAHLSKQCLETRFLSIFNDFSRLLWRTIVLFLR